MRFNNDLPRRQYEQYGKRQTTQLKPLENCASWKEVRIAAGIERQARDFELSVTKRWPGDDQQSHRIQHGASCTVHIGDERVLTGYVFATPIRYDAHQIECSIAGRSRTADLIDCAADTLPGQWRNTPVARIIEALAAPYGIQVVSEAPAQMRVDHAIQAGETVFESIDRLLQLSRVLSTDNANGQLVITRPGSAGRAADALTLGENLLSGEAELDFAGVFSEYVCKGQRSGSDIDSGAHINEVQARVTDPRMSRRRVNMHIESGQLTPELARQRVVWERENRLSGALKTTYTVNGWRQSNGALWQPNQIVRVVDPVIGFERDMLIFEVAYRLDARGMRSALTVAPPEGFEAEPVHPKKGKREKTGDAFEYLLPQDWDKDL